MEKRGGLENTVEKLVCVCYERMMIMRGVSSCSWLFKQAGKGSYLTVAVKNVEHRTILIGFDGVFPLLQAIVCCTQPTVALGPVWFELHTLCPDAVWECVERSSGWCAYVCV